MALATRYPLLYVEFHVDCTALPSASFDCISEVSQPSLIHPLLPTASEVRPQVANLALSVRLCTEREHGARRPWWECVESTALAGGDGSDDDDSDGLLLSAPNSNHGFKVLKVYGAILGEVTEPKDGDLKVVVTDETFIRLVVVACDSPSRTVPEVALWLDVTPGVVVGGGASSPTSAAPWTWGGHNDPFLHDLALAPYPDAIVAEAKLRMEKLACSGARFVSTSSSSSSSSSSSDRSATAAPRAGTDASVLLRNSADGGLLIYDAVSGSGKTVLAANAAAKLSKESGASVYVLQCSKLISTAPFQAPSLLSTIVHFLALQNAVRGKPVVFILDKVECLVPRRDLFPENSDAFERSMKNDLGDPVVATLHILSSLLRRLSSSLASGVDSSSFGSVPFPSSSVGNVGVVDALHRHLYPSYPSCCDSVVSFHFPGLALVGVLTAPPDAFVASRTAQVPAAIGLLGGRLMLPPLSGKDRVAAFKKVMLLLDVQLCDDVDDALFAHASLIKGGDFLSAVSELKSRGDYSVFGVTSVLKPYADSSEVYLRIAPKNTSRSAAAPSRVANPFDNVGGNREAKIALEDALALSTSKRASLARMGIGAPIGVLLYGPPGTGKTLLARATAEAIRFSNRDGAEDEEGDGEDGENNTRGGAFVMLKASEVVMGEVGSSEKIVVEAFETVRRNGGGVIFIDEFQALFVKRGGAEGGSRLASVLLECMDEVKTCEMNIVRIASEGKKANERVKVKRGGRIVVLAATNSPKDVDPAFLRPGRFDCVVHVGLPNELERREIVGVIVREMRINAGPGGEREGEEGVEQNITTKESVARRVAELTEGYSGADLQQLCNAAALKCIALGEEGLGVKIEHFERCLGERKIKKGGAALGMGFGGGAGAEKKL